MSALHWLLHILREPGDLIAYGYPLITLIIFTESALFPFLPGDSLLVVAGIYASKGDINLAILTLLLIPALYVSIESRQFRRKSALASNSANRVGASAAGARLSDSCDATRMRIS